MALTIAIFTVLGSLLAFLLKVWPTASQRAGNDLDEEKRKQDALIREWVDGGNDPR